MKNKNPMDSINISNLELYRDQSKSYKESIRKIFFTCLKELDRELIIDALKNKKIIKTDLNLKTNKMELMEIAENKPTAQNNTNSTKKADLHIKSTAQNENN